MFCASCQCSHYCRPIAPSEDCYQEAQELVYHVGLVEAPQYPQVRIAAGRQDQAQEGCQAIYRAHPQNCHDLPLDERLIHLAQMGRHVKHGYQTREEREGAHHIDHRKVALLFYLLSDFMSGRFNLPLEFFDLMMFRGHSPGERLQLQEHDSAYETQYANRADVEGAHAFLGEHHYFGLKERAGAGDGEPAARRGLSPIQTSILLETLTSPHADTPRRGVVGHRSTVTTGVRYLRCVETCVTCSL